MATAARQELCTALTEGCCDHEWLDHQFSALDGTPQKQGICQQHAEVCDWKG